MTVDVVPTVERRLLTAIGELYDLVDAGTEDLARSLRMATLPHWCCVLIRSWAGMA